MKVALTGSTGFIGKAVSAETPRDAEIIRLGRNLDEIRWDMRDTSQPNLLEFDSIVHSGWITAPRSARVMRSNYLSSLELLSLAQERNATFVMVSSQSASEFTRSLYGQTKFALERKVLAYSKGVVLRPGTVRDEWGQVGMLESALSTLAALPVRLSINPSPMVPLVSLDRVVDAVWFAALSDPFLLDSRILQLVDHWEPLEHLVESRRGVRRVSTLSVQTSWLTATARLAHVLPLGRMRDSADSWLGLVDLPGQVG